jgi:hypothetical protein
MNYLTKLFVAMRENPRGQVMNDYVLIAAALTVTGMTAHRVFGGTSTMEFTIITAAY